MFRYVETRAPSGPEQPPPQQSASEYRGRFVSRAHRSQRRLRRFIHGDAASLRSHEKHSDSLEEKQILVARRAEKIAALSKRMLSHLLRLRRELAADLNDIQSLRTSSSG